MSHSRELLQKEKKNPNSSHHKINKKKTQKKNKKNCYSCGQKRKGYDFIFRDPNNPLNTNQTTTTKIKTGEYNQWNQKKSIVN